MRLPNWIAALRRTRHRADRCAQVVRGEPTAGPFPFLYVEDDGAARELTADERAYLRTPFHPADGARPYVKRGYHERTPDGGLRGFLHRGQLPSHVRVGPAEDQ